MNSDAPILGIGLLTWHTLAPARRSGAGVEVVQSSSAPPLRPGLTRVGTSPPTRRDTRSLDGHINGARSIKVLEQISPLDPLHAWAGFPVQHSAHQKHRRRADPHGATLRNRLAMARFPTY